MSQENSGGHLISMRLYDPLMELYDYLKIADRAIGAAALSDAVQLGYHTP